MAIASSATRPADLVEADGGVGVVSSLFSISRSTRAFLALLLARIGLHPGQDQLLERLSPGQTISVSVLAGQLSVRPSTVSKMLDRLIERNLVQRVVSTGDARRTMVLLTEEGEAMQGRIREVWQRLDEEIAKAIAPEDRTRVAVALSQVESAINVRLRRLR